MPNAQLMLGLCRKEEPMELYGAIDLHARNSVVVVLDEEDRSVLERRVANRLEGILELFSPYREDLVAVAVESTFNWYWLVDGLQEAGYEVELVNTCAVQQYVGLKYADDRHDARWLAHLLRLGILPTGWICPKEQRGLRDLLRCRCRLVEQRTAHLLALQSVLARELGEMVTGNELKDMSVVAEAMGRIEDELVVGMLESRLHILEVYDKQILALEKRAREQFRAQCPYPKLRSLPGVGEILSWVISCETGQIDRFQKVGEYSSYCRCVRSERTTNRKRKGEGNRKNGNPYLSWAFSEVAHHARRWHRPAQRFHERKLARCSKRIVADRALAHKFARAAYYVMRDGVPYEASMLFG